MTIVAASCMAARATASSVALAMAMVVSPMRVAAAEEEAAALAAVSRSIAVSGVVGVPTMWGISMLTLALAIGAVVVGS